MADSSVDPPRVTGLNIFPIKSCKAVEVSKLEFDEFGVVGDRRFMIIGSQKCRMISQRQYPLLATVSAKYAVERGTQYLCISAPSVKQDLTFEPVLEGSSRLNATVWDSHVSVIDQGDGPAQWFNELLGQGPNFCRLVASAEREYSDTNKNGFHFQRQVDLLPSTKIVLQDAAPISLISHESLVDLNKQMQEKGGDAVPLNRFRMNIEISGCTRPYEEDEWQQICIGDVPFHVYASNERCKMTGVNQTTGEVDKLKPVDVLKTYRMSKFGQYLRPLQVSGKIQLGDVVQIVERKEEE